MKIINLKIKDNSSNDITKELDVLKHELNISSNTDVVKYLIKNYRKIIGNTVLNFEPRYMYKVTYSDGSTGYVLLSDKEKINFKNSLHYSTLTSDDVLAVHFELLQ